MGSRDSQAFDENSNMYVNINIHACMCNYIDFIIYLYACINYSKLKKFIGNSDIQILIECLEAYKCTLNGHHRSFNHVQKLWKTCKNAYWKF